MELNRRNFVKITGITGAGIIAGGISACHTNPVEIKFLSPIDGDMLHEIDGPVVNGSLSVPVKISAPPRSKITINGIEAKYTNDLFTAEVPLKEYRNILEVRDCKTGTKESITIYWLKNYVNRYRVSLDDNIWFLKDISENAGNYKSIFDNPYLSFFKHIHNTFGTKIHINIYYQTEGFNLSQMTTKFKNEWRDNSGWLRLSFHALQNDPDRPYTNAGYDQVKKDCDMVMDQIKRFAGEGLMGPVTTLHWGESTREGSRALRDAGYIVQVSDFIVEKGIQTISMYLDLPQSQHMNERFIWRDNSEGIIFSRISIVINNHKVDKIGSFLDNLKKDPHKSAYMDLLMHEQYFYPFYKAYQSDFREKVTASVKWAADNGYKPAFLSECVLS